MYKFSSGLANQKDDFFMSTHFKLVMIVLLTVVLLGGCGGETKVIGQPPVITIMDVTWDTVVVVAEDDKEVVGYIITTSKETPTLNDPKWKAASLFTIDEDGTYYVWAKDGDGNISEPKEAVIAIENSIERLAPEHLHLGWYLDSTATKTVNGKEYNLNELRQQYGDLYRFVEPLSKEEIEQRFEYIVNYIIKDQSTSKEFGMRYNSGLEERKLGETYTVEYRKIESSYRKSLYTTKDSVLDDYSKYYFELDENRYARDLPDTFDSEQTSYRLGTDSIEKVPLNDKDWFVREYMTGVDLSINLAKEMGLNLEFFFDPQLGYTK